MTAAQQKTSLTDAPKNAKEAIDWILRLSGRDKGMFWDGDDAMIGLTTTLSGLLDNTNQDLAQSVQKIFNEAIQCVIQQLGQSLNNTNGYFTKYFKELSDVEKAEGKIVDIDKWVTAVKHWIEEGYDPLGQTDGPIIKFADSLAVLMGYNNGQLNDEGLAKKDVYVSAYDANNATWAAVKTSKKENECVCIFLDVVITLFPLLSLLYWNGRRDKKSEDGVWADERLCNSGSELSKFLNVVGFKDFEQLHTVYTKIVGHKRHNNYASTKQNCSVDLWVKGSTLSGRIQTAFREFGMVMSGDDHPSTFGDFLKKLIERAKCDCVFDGFCNEGICANTNSRNSSVNPFPFAKLFIIAIAYQKAIESSSITKTVLASAAAVTGVGISAYLAYISNLIPTLATLL
ncbi:variant erythrocyte surface antigen-1 family protein [Babesia caballi]|uniref:Variant erythrocyte surface antigen-1 family protein n=1 Tax=Babesia caballi TaxID=5871 RepID=A0AAV4LU41_BABCB|nr:variant erythrocyte surface antigen-1 family protein [Babesia caballi]